MLLEKARQALKCGRQILPFLFYQQLNYRRYAMDVIHVWLPPALIIGVILYTNRLLATGLNKRIDDLRSQMSREHDTLAKKVDDLKNDVRDLTAIVTKHISDFDIHSKR